MNVIIFSKDRAAQLDLLLRSYPQNMDEPIIIYHYSGSQYMDGYVALQSSHPRAVLIKQGCFELDITDYNMDRRDRRTMFLTDDDIFINPLPKIPAIPDNVACLSLRLNPRMDYCYTLNRFQKAPKMMQPCNIWNWRIADADYGYPMSLDGHIFRTADILPLLEKLDYHDPNSLEAALARNPINRPMMMCFDKSVIVNNPINRVQDTIKNRHGNVSAEWLNKQFLAGRRIKLEPFIGIEPNACHVELPIEWE